MVEDDAVIGRAVQRAADGLLEARLAGTGQQALEALAGAELPRFILLDFGLPDMDGLQVLRRLRADPRCSKLPVILFSSLRDPERVAQTAQAGADAWVPKPDDPVALREAVRTLCKTWGEARRSASAT
ncbi:MAG TPA: response regulator [Candidatus Thermoplasmatota archaeon]|nr:response regulator [Candidatus Thermoplasmatota archaeon]